MSLTQKDLNQIKKLMDHSLVQFEAKFDKKMDKKLEKFATRDELQEVIKQFGNRFDQQDRKFETIDRRFDELEAKIPDKDELFNKLDNIVHLLQNHEIEITATSQRVVEQNDRLTKIENIYPELLQIA